MNSLVILSLLMDRTICHVAKIIHFERALKIKTWNHKVEIYRSTFTTDVFLLEMWNRMFFCNWLIGFLNEMAQRFHWWFCQIFHPTLITRSRLIDYSLLGLYSVKKMPQLSQSQLRSPREHQMGRIRVHFREPCVLEVVNLGTERKWGNHWALLSRSFKISKRHKCLKINSDHQGNINGKY